MSHQNWREKILGHLRFARQWLERAEDDFSRDDTLRGELNLALVEAEVRHAWEMSAGKFCQEEQVPKRRPYTLAMAAAAGVLVLAVSLWQFGLTRSPKDLTTKTKAAAVQVPKEVPKAPPQAQITRRSPTLSQPVAEKAKETVQKLPAKATPVSATLVKQEPPVVLATKEPEREVAQVKTVEPSRESLPVESPKKEDATLEHNLGELTQLAREVLYAKSDS